MQAPDNDSYSRLMVNANLRGLEFWAGPQLPGPGSIDILPFPRKRSALEIECDLLEA